MSRLRAILARLRGLAGDRDRDADLAAEIDSHLQLHIDDNLRAGMTPDQARRAALLKFGGVEAAKEAHRDLRRPQVLSLCLRDLRHGLRILRRDRGFAVTAIITLSIGVGANAAMFGLVDALMFRPPAGVHDPDRVVGLTGVRNYLRFLDLRDRTRTLDVAAYTRATLTLGRGPEATPIRTECVTASFFPLLGARPHAGRTFGAADEKAGTRTVIVGHRLWRDRLGAAADVVGRSVEIAGRQFEIIGVAPAGFRGVELEPVDAWLVLTTSPELCSFTGTNLLWSDGAWLSGIGRIQAGVTIDAAAAELATFTRVDGVLASGKELRFNFGLRPLDDARGIGVAANRRLAWWLAAGALAVLLIACANVGGLLAIRAIDRRREIAVRLQVGGSRRRIFAQLVTEHLVLAALCCGAAILVAVGLDRTLRGFFVFAAEDGLLTGRALVILAAFAILAAIASGVLPALQASRTSAGDWRVGPPQMPHRSRLRHALLAAQVAGALTLVMAAGLFVGSLGHLERGLGFDLDRVISVSLDLRRTGRDSPSETRATFDRLAAAVQRMPAVESVALSSSALVGSSTGSSIVTFLRSSLEPQAGTADIVSQFVSPTYFATVGTTIVAGRQFAPGDLRSPGDVAVIDAALARQLWPDGQAVGRCAYQGSTCLTIVGVIDTRRRRVTSGSPELFQPLRDNPDSETTPQVLLVRTRSHAARVVDDVAATVRGAAADLPYVEVRTLESLADDRTRSWRLGATIFTLFGIVAVILTVVGIYASLAFSTRRQAAEIGLRMTLGATPADVLAMVARRGAIIVGAGWAFGALATWLLTDLIRSQLFQVSPTDPRAFAIASLVVVAAGLAGTIVPAARAARVDPAITLRNE